ncbi:hypothetical protein H8E52_12185 [bacterium]|nr:hypothetical protein [bacterium]
MRDRLTFLLVLAALALAGCAPNVSRNAKVRERLVKNEVPSALVELQNEDCRTVDCLLQRGHLAYLAGDYDQTQRDLEVAEWLIQDLWTVSLSREAASLVVSDNTTAYSGQAFEKVWLNYVRALAYLDANEPWEAAVEGRALSRKLGVMADEVDDESGYHNDPFLQYFAGLLAEADGDLNRAWINYRHAERLYKKREIYGVSPPPSLGRSLLKAAEGLAFSEEAQSYRDQYGASSTPQSEMGEVVLLVSEGLIPGKRTLRIDFPIFESKGKERNALVVAAYSYEHWHSPPRAVDYWVSVALPELEASKSAPALRWSSSVGSGQLGLGADIGFLNRKSFEDEYGKVVIRAVARALVKFWGTKKVEEKGGQVWGIIANIVGSATEWADTRSWATLPEHVYIERLQLPAGEQRVQVGRASGTVNVPEGGIAFLHLRLN